MKPPVALSFALFTLPALISAQNPQPAQAPSSQPTVNATFNGALQVSSCPVAMQAKQGSGSGLVMVKREGSPDGSSQDGQSVQDTKPSQRIHLILGKMPGTHFSDPHQIAAASVTAKGLSARDHLYLTLSPAGNSASDLTRTLNVTFNTEKDGSVSADLNLPGFTSVNSIKLESVSLKDGSTWKLADFKTCVVTPDRLMLVAAQ
jgi:hypothetical protein